MAVQFVHLCLPFMHLMHQIQTLDWPDCLLKAHGLKPILVAPQPRKFILSSAFFGCLYPLCVQTCQPPDMAQSQCPAGVSKQQGSHLWASMRRNVSLAVGCWKSHMGSKKSKLSSGLDDSAVWTAELFLNLSSRHQLSPVGAITLPCLPGLINLYLPHHQSAKWLFEHYFLPRNPCLILQRGP